jgi:hypothetical protein
MARQIRTVGFGGSDLSFPAGAPAPTPPPAALAEIPLTISRLDGSTGTVLVSNGIMLAPGQLQDTELGGLAMVVDDVGEVPVYVEALTGRHLDGSVISVLVQFMANPSTHGTGKLLFGATPGQARRTKVPIDFRPTRNMSDPRLNGYPSAMAHASPEYNVTAIGPVWGDTLTRAAAIARGGDFADYETQHEQWSDYHWGIYGPTQVIGGNYYDRGMFTLIHGYRSSNPEYFKRGAAYAFNHRDEYYEANAYNITHPHMWFPEGMVLHYWTTGDERSAYGVRQLATTRVGPTPAEGGTSWQWNNTFKCSYEGEARQMARTLLVALWAVKLGWRTATTAHEGAALVLRGGINSNMWDTNTATYRYGAWTFTHPDYPPGAGCSIEYVSNFMQCLLYDTLRTYERLFGAHAGSQARRTLIANYFVSQWRDVEGNNLMNTAPANNYEPVPSFNYYDVEVPESGGVGPTVDLNGFYCHIMRLTANETANSVLGVIAAKCFNGLMGWKDGTEGPYVSQHKQFNETYQKAWQYCALAP